MTFEPRTLTTKHRVATWETQLGYSARILGLAPGYKKHSHSPFYFSNTSGLFGPRQEYSHRFF